MKKYVLIFMIVLLFVCQSATGATYAAFLRDTGVDGSTIEIDPITKRIGITPQARAGGLISSGDPYYVDAVNGQNNRSGKTWRLAVASLNTAFDLIGSAQTAGTELGDPIIYIREGHSEPWAVASAMAFDVADIKVQGMGYGSARPIFTISGVSLSPAEVLANNIWIDNCRFLATVSGVPSALYVASVTNFRITNCDFSVTSPGSFLRALNLAEHSDNAYIAGNTFRLSPSVDIAASAAIQFSTVSRITIEHNNIIGNFEFGNIYGAKVSQDVMIRYNFVINGSETADSGLNNKPALEVANSSAGTIAYNTFAANLGAKSMRVGNDMKFFSNVVLDSDGDEFSGYFEGLYTASYLSSPGGTNVTSGVSN